MLPMLCWVGEWGKLGPLQRCRNWESAVNQPAQGQIAKRYLSWVFYFSSLFLQNWCTFLYISDSKLRKYLVCRTKSKVSFTIRIMIAKWIHYIISTLPFFLLQLQVENSHTLRLLQTFISMFPEAWAPGLGIIYDQRYRHT